MNNQIDQSQPAEESVAQAKQVSSSPFSKYLPLIIIALVAVLIASTGTYFVLKQSKIQSQNLSRNTVTSSPIPSRANGSAATATWKTYNNENISFKYPSNWKQNPIQLLGSGSIQEIEGIKGVYTLSFTSRANYNNGTGKPFASLNEYMNIPHAVKTVTIDGQEGIQQLPRVGSENVNAVNFFSKDSKFIYTLTLTTDTSGSNEAKIQEGQRIFDQILSTFKFVSKYGAGTRSIIVLSPNGGERWIRGNTHDIKWESRGEITRVNIILYNKNTSAYVINVVTDYPNTGMYRWKIPLEPHAPIVDYGIEVRESRTGSLYVADGSDGLFIIQSP